MCQKPALVGNLAKAGVDLRGRYRAVIWVFWDSYDHKFISALRVLCGCRSGLAFSPDWRQPSVLACGRLRAVVSGCCQGNTGADRGCQVLSIAEFGGFSS
jgi:hypothetical protein